MSDIPLDQLSAECFAALLRTKFQVLLEPGLAVSLELTAVTVPSRGGQEIVPPVSQKFEGFSLLFDGTAAHPLSQRTYRFTHERLGSFDLFIVPVSATPESRQYEAVFNRRVSPETSR